MRCLAIRVRLSSSFTIQTSWMGSQKPFRQSIYWYHVMQHESFENVAIASFLNEYFDSIKVDREQNND